MVYNHNEEEEENDYQGKRPDQVKSSERICFYTIISFTILLAVFLWEIYSQL